MQLSALICLGMAESYDNSPNYLRTLAAETPMINSISGIGLDGVAVSSTLQLITATPEPSVLTMMLFGAILLVIARTRAHCAKQVSFQKK